MAPSDDFEDEPTPGRQDPGRSETRLRLAAIIGSVSLLGVLAVGLVLGRVVDGQPPAAYAPQPPQGSPGAPGGGFSRAPGGGSPGAPGGGSPGAPGGGSPGGEAAPPSGQEQTYHQVVPGDNLWTIARDPLAEVRGGADEPTLRKVAAYWLRVVEANRDRLVSGDPDLIYPGERIVLPPVD
jgi:nucleoid-associated protein YgaU